MAGENYIGHYIDQSAIERRLSPAVVRRVYDDGNIGMVGSSIIDPLGQLIIDAEAKFEGYCRGIYSLSALRTAKPTEAIRLVLDIAEALAAKRFPRAMNRDWMVLEQSVNAELKSLRRGETRFDVEGNPEPPANEGGYVSSGDVESPDVRPATFNGNWGSF